MEFPRTVDRSERLTGPNSGQRSLSSETEVDQIARNHRHRHAARCPAVILVRRNLHLDMLDL